MVGIFFFFFLLLFHSHKHTIHPCVFLIYTPSQVFVVTHSMICSPFSVVFFYIVGEICILKSDVCTSDKKTLVASIFSSSI